jgi:hypothetical protein
VSGRYAYVASGESGLRVIDIDHPASPVDVGYFETADFARKVAVSDHTVYLADNNDGLYVLLFDPPPTATVVRAFSARAIAEASDCAVVLEWAVFADERLRGCAVYRRDDGPAGGFVPLSRDGILSPSTRTYRDDTAVPGRTYDYRLGVLTQAGNEVFSSIERVRIPAPALALHQSFPNPSRRGQTTTIAFTLQRDAHVRLEVFDVSGRKVRTLVDAPVEAGYQTAQWDGRNDGGETVGSGVFLYVLRAEGSVLARKSILLR